MTELAKIHDDDSRWLSLEEIAQWGNFSQGYLEEIVTPLRKAELVQARKGAGGGYRLSREPKKIPTAEILEAFHGHLALVPCLDKESSCALTASCASHHLWSFLQQAISKSLGETTLADIVKKSKATPYTLQPTP